MRYRFELLIKGYLYTYSSSNSELRDKNNDFYNNIKEISFLIAGAVIKTGFLFSLCKFSIALLIELTISVWSETKFSCILDFSFASDNSY